MTDTVSNAHVVKATSQWTGWRYGIDVGRASEGGVEVGFEFDEQMRMSVWSVGPYNAS